MYAVLCAKTRIILKIHSKTRKLSVLEKKKKTILCAQWRAREFSMRGRVVRPNNNNLNILLS